MWVSLCIGEGAEFLGLMTQDLAHCLPNLSSVSPTLSPTSSGEHRVQTSPAGSEADKDWPVLGCSGDTLMPGYQDGGKDSGPVYNGSMSTQGNLPLPGPS